MSQLEKNINTNKLPQWPAFDIRKRERELVVGGKGENFRKSKEVFPIMPSCRSWVLIDFKRKTL